MGLSSSLLRLKFSSGFLPSFFILLIVIHELTLHTGIACTLTSAHCLCDNRKRKYVLLGDGEVLEITEKFRGIVLDSSGKKVVTCRYGLINYKDAKALTQKLLQKVVCDGN
jgi:hypothetical protein